MNHSSSSAASIKQRLLRLSRETGEDHGLTLLRYANEGLLRRVALSPHCDLFVLKGAHLFYLWSDTSYRPTRDLDFGMSAGVDTVSLLGMFRSISELSVSDSLAFDADSVAGEPIREDQAYAGVRITMLAHLGQARLHLQIDIGFGDVLTPGPVRVEIPSMIGMPKAALNSYPPETVVAEKFQAMVALGITNSRLKDFYDIWTMAQAHHFYGDTIRQAIAATFERRQTQVPTLPPVALTREFADEPTKLAQWDAFLLRSGLNVGTKSFAEVIDELHHFLMPPCSFAAKGAVFEMLWSSERQWTPT